MRRIARPWVFVVLAFLLDAVVAALVYRSTAAAQADAAVVLSNVLEPPGLTWTVERLTDEPRVEEIDVAGAPSTLVRPSGSGPWPAIVFANGATARGRRHPDVQAVARGLGRAGYLALVPDLPGLAAGEITPRTLSATVAVAESVASRPDVRGGRVGLVGVSVGASLALLAAEDPALAGRVSVVAGIAPYADLANVLRLATTGFYEDDGTLVHYETNNFLSLVAGRSLVAALPPGPDRSSLLAVLPETDEVGDDPPDPLAPLRARRLLRTGAARAVVALLVNRDSRRFDRLYGKLPAGMRAAHARLSPVSAAEDLRAPVELASAPHDKYFPIDESNDLARAAPDVRVTVTTTLEHAVPAASLRDLADLFRFDAFVVRALEHAAASG